MLERTHCAGHPQRTACGDRRARQQHPRAGQYLDGIGDSEIVGVNIPNGVPLVYELDDDTLKPIRSYYLNDPPPPGAA